MANLKRRNHYLPACYQAAFTNSAGQVWVKLTNKSKPERRNPKNLGWTRSLYIVTRDGEETDKVEDFFSEQIETPFAILSRRIKEEQDKFATISGNELGILARFVASQAVRTLGHKECIEEQAQARVDTETFVRVMGRKTITLLSNWIQNPPALHFFTSLPHIGDRFITGDHPVVVTIENYNPVWVPRSEPTLGITNLTDILSNPKHGFLIPLSPYVCLGIQGKADGEPRLPPAPVDPQFVRFVNGCIRGQSKYFILARDAESLE
jgi:Protein of unknown function (DUF4238)